MAKTHCTHSASFEMKLIKAVKKSRVWSKDNFPANSKGLEQGWNAVSRQINSSTYRCRTRWKSLRKTFRQHVIRSGTTGIKPDWPYYDQMLFLLDSLKLTGSLAKSNTTTAEKEIEMDAPEPDPAEEPLEVTPQVSVGQVVPAPIIRAISVDSITKEEPHIMDKVSYAQEATTTTEAVEQFAQLTSTTQSPPPALQRDRLSALNEGTAPEEFGERSISWRTIDTDEQFLLSCLNTMKQLSRRRNALVRLQIQQLMYEAEFAEEDETRSALYNNR